MSKSVALMLLALLAMSSLVMVGSAFAQSVPKPSVPEFTLELVDHSYDVPTTYSIDPYTGETIPHEGYHVENKSIEVWIKNPAFTPYSNDEEQEVNLYYNVRVKGHFEEEWTTPSTILESDSATNIQPSSSEYTVLSLRILYPPNAQVDFQVEAFLAHLEIYESEARLIPPATGLEVDESSGWSNTYTLTISEPYTAYQEIVIGVIVAAVFVFGLVLLYRIKRK